ncbi:MAG: hypothetical protein IPF56_21330 [Chloroflexi bacterium]|nr:hypothetical protein [Chloroflexota bacterium]
MMRRRSTPPPSPSVMLPISRGAYLLILLVAILLYWVLVHYLERLDLTVLLNNRWHIFAGRAGFAASADQPGRVF